MPTTKKENFYFGLMMCVGMVIGMVSYNLLANDLLGTISFQGILLQYVMAFAVAFIVELFIVGPIAKKLAFAIPYDKSKMVLVIIVLALCMVSGMVLSMSLYGMAMAYFSNGLNGESLLQSYFSLVVKNFIFALPLQLIVVGPLVRFLFPKINKVKKLEMSIS